MYKQDLALNNLQGVICPKTQPTYNIALLAGAAEYTDYISAEG